MFVQSDSEKTGFKRENGSGGRRRGYLICDAIEMGTVEGAGTHLRARDALGREKRRCLEAATKESRIQRVRGTVVARLKLTLITKVSEPSNSLTKLEHECYSSREPTAGSGTEAARGGHAHTGGQRALQDIVILAEVTG